jgi:single-stranded DNA-binding protein
MSKAAITIEGFVANELELKTTPSNHRVVAISVPHTPQKKTDSGWEDSGPTTWFEAAFWDEHADVVLRSVEKGALVTLSGIPQVQAYAKRDGTPGAKVMIQFAQLAVVVRRPKRGETPTGSPVSSSTESQVWTSSAADYDDQTPF